MTGFWTGDRPLVLASSSLARRALLEAAHIPLVIVPAVIDERIVEAPLRSSGAAPAAIAASLAVAKALDVSRARPADLVLGADQTLALDSRMFTKAATLAEARSNLEDLSGRTHSLHSAWALTRDGLVVEQGLSEARLTMRPLSPAFLDRYVAAEGATLRETVGAYRLEGLGVLLFDAIDGDHATILGLPLLQVLAALRAQGCLIG